MAHVGPREARLVSRHTRFLAAIAALAGGAIVIVALSFGLTESERLDVQTASQTAVQLRDLAGELSDAARDQESAVDDYMLGAGTSALTTFEGAVAGETRVAAEMQTAARGLPAVRAAIGAVTDASSAWQTTYARPAIAAVQAGGGSALGPFTTRATGDHEAVHSALLALNRELSRFETSLGQRENALALTRLAGTGIGLGALVIASLLALWLIRRYGRALELDAMHAGVLNRFTEVTSFASDDTAVAASNLEALALLVHPDAAVTHVLNHSRDRAVPEAILGDAIAEVLPLHALAQCAGLMRGSMYVTEDAQAALSVHCPVYPVQRGTVACVPLNSGESIGAVHLYWERPHAMPLELRASVSRIAEHAALSISNRRLLAALRGQASTDARTGLANNRAFDRAVDEALAARVAQEPVSILMLDIDHFKAFNDRYGHPGGDEALRTLAEVLRSCMREGDLAARYGGEEFTVLLPGLDAPAARVVAERIRARTESTIVALAPGITARMTVSAGVAVAPTQGVERASLLRAADAALYRAKEAGRNRVADIGEIAGRSSGASAGRGVGRAHQEAEPASLEPRQAAISAGHPTDAPRH